MNTNQSEIRVSQRVIDRASAVGVGRSACFNQDTGEHYDEYDLRAIENAEREREKIGLGYITEAQFILGIVSGLVRNKISSYTN